MDDLVITHASLDTFASDDDNAADVERLVAGLVDGEPRDLITLTETGEAATVHMIRVIARDHYHVVNPDAGDVTFLLHRDYDLEGGGGRLVIPAVHAPAARGGHGPRYVSHITTTVAGHQWTHVGVHLVTASSHHDGRPDRQDQQRRQARVMANMMRNLGRGTALATGSGDLNTALPADRDMQAIFDGAGLTTTAHELEVNDPTHGNRRIDYVWTRDADHRLEVTHMTVRHGAAWNSDHDPIDVRIRVRP